MFTNLVNPDIKPGAVVKIKSNGKKLDAFVIRTFIGGEFRAIQGTWGQRGAGFWLAGRLDELSRYRREMEAASEVFAYSQVVGFYDPNKFAVKQFRRAK